MTARIGLHGPINNSAYGLAAGLAAAGVNVTFVRSRDTTLAIDQPVWQDADFTLSAEEFASCASWDWSRWTALEADVGWAPPPWLVDPVQRQGRPYVPAPDTSPVLRAALTAAGRRRPGWGAIQQCWSNTDLLIVSGSRPALLASGSGLPFVVWPHGSDARKAVRDFPPYVRGIRLRTTSEIDSLLLRHAYRASLALVTHDPLLVTGNAARAAALERLAQVRFLAWPVVSSARRTPEQRRERLHGLLERLGAQPATGDVVVLVASRIDYRLKGHDRLIQALTELGDCGIHYLFVAWGADLPRARIALDAAGLGERISLLPRIMSKPVVRALYASVDLSLDQFVYGTYGTAALESMATGTPVVMAVDEAAFHRRGWEPPPALHGRSAAQLLKVLRSVADGRIDLEAASTRSHEWIERRHAPAAVRAQLDAVLAEFGASGRQTQTGRPHLEGARKTRPSL